ncbi:MAG TPA: hypothetical protein VI976_00950 [Candidatus Omnitrophota bacterium]|nr:hypothetical protein [Candidatus Omnitrophota bacterium]
MEQKAKFIIIGLIAILVASLFINLFIYSAKQSAVKESDALKIENASLEKKAKEANENNKRLEAMVSSLNTNLNNLNRDKESLQARFELANRARDELINKIKSLEAANTMAAAVSREERPQAAAAPMREDAYWAGILQAKKHLEAELEDTRSKLRELDIDNGQLQKEKGALGLEVVNLGRDKEDLERQLEYNQKLMDGLAQELVSEKNDKFQIQDTLKIIRNENSVLKRQINSLNSRRLNVERKLAGIEKEKLGLENKLHSSDALLKDNISEVDNLKRRLESGQRERPSAQKGLSGEAKEKAVELAPIVVRSQSEASAASSAGGRVLAVNRENNFVIIDAGEDAGIRTGDALQVYRDGEAIASIEAVQVRRDISACDIKKETEPIKVEDTVH